MDGLRKAFALAALLAATFCTAPARATTYDVNLFLGTSAVQGTIDTDGTMGWITAANITSSNLQLYFEGGSGVALPNVELILRNFTTTPLSASNFGLTWDFGLPVFDDTDAELYFRGTGVPVAHAFFALYRWQTCDGTFGTGFCVSEEGFDHFFPESGQLQFATIASSVTPTPLPGALPLFATGFAGLGLLARGLRRRGLAARRG
jgi:hypothetical protein